MLEGRAVWAVGKRWDVDNRQKEPNMRKKQIAVVSLIVLVGISLSLVLVKDRIFPKRFGVVVDGQVYRSGRISAGLIKGVLEKYKIGVIVDLTGNSPKNIDQIAEQKAAADLGIVRHKLPLKGNGTGDIDNYVEAIKIIVQGQKDKKAVLVHCAAGAQRTGGVIAAYRLLVEHKKPSFVLKELMKYDWDPQKNGVLIDYLYENMPELAKRLLELGVIDQLPKCVLGSDWDLSSEQAGLESQRMIMAR